MRKAAKIMFFIALWFVIWGVAARPAAAEPFIAAYQKIYAMNFEVWRPAGLPPGWYLTFDGYLVAQAAANHWVYGRVGRGDSLVLTDVPVGSVVPTALPDLARGVAFPWYGGVCDTDAFRALATFGPNNAGILDDPLGATPVAWKLNGSEFYVYVWMGDRWRRLTPPPGGSVRGTLRSWHPFILRTLREKGAVWTHGDTARLVELSREWGCVWRGSLSFSAFVGFRDDEGRNDAWGGSGGSSGWDPSEGGSSGDDREWDTGDGGGGSSGGGGGWDTGGDGGDGSSGGGGGGWDSGGGDGGGSGDSDGDDGGNDGGWDK